MIYYETVSEAVNGLKSRGYTLDFNLQENCIICNELELSADQFEITEMHRFEGNTDPADEAVVYGITSAHGKMGVLVTGYGISAEGMGAAIAKKLSFHK